MWKHKKATVMAIILALAVLPAAVALAVKPPLDVHGTAWHLYSKVQLKVQKVGGFKDVDENMLFIGPNAGEGLADNEFKITSAGAGDDYTGTWSDPKGNGSLLLDFDADDLEDFLLGDVVNILQTKYSSVMLVTLNTTKLQAKCKVKPGKGASASLKASFLGTGVLDGEYQEGKVSFAFKGKGVEEF